MRLLVDHDEGSVYRPHQLRGGFPAWGCPPILRDGGGWVRFVLDYGSKKTVSLKPQKKRKMSEHERMNRRGFLGRVGRLARLGAGAGILTGIGASGVNCSGQGSRRHLSFRMILGGDSTVVRIQKTPTKAKLGINESLTLRRYIGESSPAVREKELVSLAQSAAVEEAFVFTEPDNIWTEIGVRTEKGSNAWKTYGVRNLPMKLVAHLFSGKYPEFPRPMRITNYHIHAIRFMRQSIRSASLPHSYERMAYLPSVADFFMAAKRRLVLGSRGIAHRSRVAVPDAVIEYWTSPELTRLIATARKPRNIKAMDTYEDALIHYVQTNLKRKDFPKLLEDRLKWAGLRGDEFHMRVRRI